MTYNEIRAELNSVQRSLLHKKKELTQTKQQLAFLQDGSSTISNDYQGNYNKAKQQGALEYKKAMLAPVEKKKINTQKRLDQLKADFKQELEGLTVESVAADCSSEQDVLEEVRESSEVLKGELKNVIGNHFYEALLNHLETSRVELDKEDLPKIINYFNQSSKTVNKMSEGGLTVNKIVDSVEDVISDVSNDSIEQNKTALMIITFAILVLSVLAAKYVFPLYVVALVVLSVFNLFRSYRLYRILIVQKAVCDNISEIDRLLNQTILEEYEKRKKEINDFYSENISAAEQELSKLQTEIMRVSITADSTFQFDDTKIKQQYEADLERNSSKKFTLEQQISTIESQMVALREQESDLKEKLNEISGNLKNSYLNFNKVGDAVLFDPVFLLDIDSNNKPVMFSHPMNNLLFLYSDLEDVSDFIRLLVVQLRNRLNSFCFNVSVFDEVTLGKNLLHFVPETENVKNSEALERLFKIYTDASEFKNKMKSLRLDMQKRMLSISTGVPQEIGVNKNTTINEYNQLMKSMDSVTLSYEFVFMIEPTMSIFDDTEVIQVLNNGGDSGIYTHLFIREDTFGNNPEVAKRLLDDDRTSVYIMQNNNLVKRCREYVLENFIPK